MINATWQPFKTEEPVEAMGRRNYNNKVGVAPQQNTATNGVMTTQPEFYRINQHVGSETRSVEFKKGVGFIQRELRPGVAKYMCGFINSAENGTLLLGIEDNGLVVGYSANHYEEDRIRKEIDEGIKDIQPDVFATDYSVQFIPVYDNTGNHPMADNWVIAISIEGARLGGRDRLFETKQGVYMRRDGSLQGPLSAQKIQEWTRRVYQTKIDALKKNEASLVNEIHRKQKDFDNKDRQINQREEAIAQVERRHKDESEALSVKLRDKQTEINLLQAENQTLKQSSSGIHDELGQIKTMLSKQGTKSKVCVIS